MEQIPADGGGWIEKFEKDGRYVGIFSEYKGPTGKGIQGFFGWLEDLCQVLVARNRPKLKGWYCRKGHITMKEAETAMEG